MIRHLIPAIAVFTCSSAALAQDPPPVACPSLVEPPGLVRFGDTFDFRIVPAMKGIEVAWKVSAGKIENGQGTQSIVVLENSTEPHGVYTITVKAEVKGLPWGCPIFYEGTAVIGCCFDPVILDEWGKLPINDQRARLDAALQDLSQNPTQVLLILLGSEKRSTEKDLLKRVKLIKDHVLGLIKTSPKRIVIAESPFGGDDHFVRIYRLPPDAAKSLCGNCRIF
jgi:hypothetical protein